MENLTVETGVGRKRKRRPSVGMVLNAAQVTANLDRYGEITLHCSINITHGIRECGNAIVLKYACALLNSGGGILHMQNFDASTTIVLPKDLDTWWSGMECKLAEIISSDDICNYFDLVGNYDDPDLYLFVKTADHICTLDFNSRLPTDTATHEVTHQSIMKLLTKRCEIGCLTDLPPIPTEFHYGKCGEDLKQETKQIQFKQLSSPQSKEGKSLAEKIRYMMIRYVSAFANHEGGHIYFGIDDVRAAVIGEDMSKEEQQRTVELVEKRMELVIWGDESFRAVQGQHWDIQFFPVIGCPKKRPRVIVVVSVCKFPGGVFTSCPESYRVEDLQVTCFSFSQWKERMLSPLKDIPELHGRFQRIPMCVPGAPLIFTLPQTVNNIKRKLIRDMTCKLLLPRRYLDITVSHGYREPIKTYIDSFLGDSCLCLGVHCWGLKIPQQQFPSILCDILVCSEADGLHLLTFAKCRLPNVVQRSRAVAAELKNKLVQVGGCPEKFGICSHIVCLAEAETRIADGSLPDISSELYPSHFNINANKFDKILDAVVISMAMYPALDSVTGVRYSSQYSPTHNDCNFLLTCDQFELLWTQQFTKELWVHGPPGAGKTVAALQLIQELRRRRCNKEEILYLAESDKLCYYVRCHDVCLVSTRRTFLQEYENMSAFTSKYGRVTNVIVDEAQNFKDWDGDWYSLAEKLANQNPSEHQSLRGGYFWVFLDYSQKVHKFKAGLPSVIGKNNFMLSEVTRNSREIFDFASHFMGEPGHGEGHGLPVGTSTGTFQKDGSPPKLGHEFSSGKEVDIVSCQETEMKKTITRIVEELLKSGIKENDIAILVGKRTDLKKVQNSVQGLTVPHLAGNDSVHERSLHMDEGGNLKVTVDMETDQTANVEKVNEDMNMDRSENMENKMTGNVDSELWKKDNSQDEGSPLKKNNAEGEGIAVDTVKGFSGLDKAAVIGVNPRVNEDHADFNRFIVNLATRARDSLVIVTTSDDIKDKLEVTQAD